MDDMGMAWGRVAGRLGWIAGCLLIGACAGFEESGLPGSASSMARDQMMLVRAEPPSFGYYRLSSLARIYPDLGVFVEKRGVPDFLAETDNGSHDYFILYYLKERHAYACRSHAGKGRGIEFAGPYPVTEGEFRTLDGFRKQQSAQ